MTTINRSPDCGHSPKNKLLEELAIARCTNDMDALDAILADDAEWNVVGQSQHTGKATVLAAIKAKKFANVEQLDVVHVTSHGKIGAVNCVITLPKGKRIDFCDVCEFANTKGTRVSKVASYVIASN